jgi:hypothetical protein
MSEQDPPSGPAESRAIELLRLVGSQTPSVSSGFSADLIARARAQRAIRGPLRALSGLVAAMAMAIAGAVRSSSRERRP